MQLDFFPSRTLTLYLAKLFVVRIFAVLVMLVLVLLALDLLSHAHVVPLVIWDEVEPRAPDGDGLLALRDIETGRRRGLWLRPVIRRRWKDAFAQRRADLQKLFEQAAKGRPDHGCHRPCRRHVADPAGGHAVEGAGRHPPGPGAKTTSAGVILAINSADR